MIALIGGSGVESLAAIPGLQWKNSAFVNMESGTSHRIWAMDRIAPTWDDSCHAGDEYNYHGESFLFVSRFGSKHQFSPSSVNYRAMIYKLKVLGVETIVSISAVGSMNPNVKPGTLVTPDDYVDRTRRECSFFPVSGHVAHVSMATPFCELAKDVLKKVGRIQGGSLSLSRVMTYVCIEGPQLSTISESIRHRRDGQIVGMTVATEAKLAREAQIRYAPICMVTDYDCCIPHEEHGGPQGYTGTSDAATIKAKAKGMSLSALNLFLGALPELAQLKTCTCRSSLERAFIGEDPNFLRHPILKTLKA